MKTKKQKQTEAKDRQKDREKRTAEQQLRELDYRPGKSKKERTRLVGY